MSHTSIWSCYYDGGTVCCHHILVAFALLLVDAVKWSDGILGSLFDLTKFKENQ